MLMGERLAHLRVLHNMSQKDVSRELNISNHLVGKYEKNIVQPSLDILVKYSILYNTSVNYLLGLEKHHVIVIDHIPEKSQDIVHRLIACMLDYFYEESDIS